MSRSARAAAAGAALGLIAAVLAQSGEPDPWAPSQLLESSALAARLSDAKPPKPKVLYVGFPVLFRSKHIPGAVFVGPTAKPDGLAALRMALAKLPRNEEVIIYCGCCPWNQCPNIRPAARLLNEMGFRNARILMAPTSFLRDWIEKGYPVEKGNP